MKYEIVEIGNISGKKAAVYSIIPEGENDSLFQRFLKENMIDSRRDVIDIMNRLQTIGKTVGARIGFFKLYEGSYGDCVCALFDIPEKHLRLYCIRYSSETLILGGGGIKDKTVRAWQDDPKLSLEANLMKAYSADIMKRLEKRDDLTWSKDKMRLEGHLKNY